MGVDGLERERRVVGSKRERAMEQKRSEALVRL